MTHQLIQHHHQTHSLDHQLPAPSCINRSSFSNAVMAKRKGLSEIQDFNNVVQRSNSQSKKKSISVISHTPMPTEQVTESEGDTFEMVKTPSSSIFIEPSNFLRESLKKDN